MNMTGIQQLGKFFEMMLVLIVGGQQPQDHNVAADDMRQYVAYDVPLYVEINPSELLEASKTIPELKNALTIAADRDAATAWLSLHLGSEPEVIKEAFTGVRQIGIWLLGIGRNPRNFRYLLVVDRGNGKNVIPAFLENNTKFMKQQQPAGRRSRRNEGYIKTSYNGVDIHGLRSNRRARIWMTEYKGKFAMASDRFALESFILHLQSPAQPDDLKRVEKKPGSIVWCEVNEAVLLNQIVTMVGRRDYEELAMVSAFVDFPAWENGTISLTMDQLEITTKINPASHLAKVLEQPLRPPALLSVLPEDVGLAFIIGLKNSGKLIDHVTDAFALVESIEGRPGGKNTMEQEFKREIGLDLKTDIAANITSMGMVWPVLSSERDLERQLTIVGEVKDAAKAEAAIGKFVTKVLDAGHANPAQDGKDKVWATDEGKVVLSGKTFMLGVSHRGESSVDKIIKAHRDETHKMALTLTKRFPDATSFAVFNPSVIFKSKDIGLLTAGLSFFDNTLKMEIDYSMAKLAKAFSDATEATILKGKKVQSVKNLEQIAKAAKAYLSDYAKYPDDFEKLLLYVKNNKDLFVSPVTDESYVFNKKIAGKQVGSVSDRSTTVLAYDSPAHLKHGGGHVLFLDGHSQWLPTANFKRAVGVR